MFEKTILEKALGAKIIAQGVKRLGNTSAIFMPGLNAETQVMAFDLAGIAVSAGAACSSGKVKQSHVLKAMNLPDELINNTIRISFGWQNTHEDVDRLIEVWLNFIKNQTNHDAFDKVGLSFTIFIEKRDREESTSGARANNP